MLLLLFRLLWVKCWTNLLTFRTPVMDRGTRPLNYINKMKFSEIATFVEFFAVTVFDGLVDNIFIDCLLCLKDNLISSRNFNDIDNIKEKAKYICEQLISIKGSTKITIKMLCLNTFIHSTKWYYQLLHCKWRWMVDCICQYSSKYQYRQIRRDTAWCFLPGQNKLQCRKWTK